MGPRPVESNSGARETIFAAFNRVVFRCPKKLFEHTVYLHSGTSWKMLRCFRHPLLWGLFSRAPVWLNLLNVPKFAPELLTLTSNCVNTKKAQRKC